MTTKINILSLILFLSFLSGFSQKGEFQINKSEKLEKIIFLKKELNKKIQNLKIQIYNGNRDHHVDRYLLMIILEVTLIVSRSKVLKIMMVMMLRLIILIRILTLLTMKC